MCSVFRRRAQDILTKKGYDISVADIQAVLWYYEKRLYGELGARQTADISYEEAAKRVAVGYANRSGGESVLSESGEQSVQEDTGAAAGRVPAGNELYQPEVSQPSARRGGYDPSRLTTILTEQADDSTFLHESSHFFLDVSQHAS